MGELDVIFHIIPYSHLIIEERFPHVSDIGFSAWQGIHQAMIVNIYFLDFSQASHSTGIIPELSDQLCPFQKGEVVLYTISADADFRCQTVCIRLVWYQGGK